MTNNIMVLKDEKLGGVEREYAEVKRRARVGEAIKIVNVDSNETRFINGDMFHVIEDAGGGDVFVALRPSVCVLFSEYVVLEPTNVVHINGERFEMVERKANAGERVIITKVTPNYGFFSLGNVGIVKSVGSDNIYVNFNGFNNCGYDRYDGNWSVGKVNGESEYRVLVPLTSDTQPKSSVPDADSDADYHQLTRKVNAQSDLINEQSAQITKMTETIANLATRLSKAETLLRVAREDIVLIEEGVTEDIRCLETAVFGKSAIQTALTREGVIERAKTDVAELIGRMDSYESIHEGNSTFKQGVNYVKFHVNRDKRVVTALVYGKYNDKLREKGFAKCAPGDVFNSHIGRAIALRRALGLEIPQEYINAPQPTEPKVGDSVSNWQGNPKLVGKRDGSTPNALSYGYVIGCGYKTIDDSREDLSE